MHSSTVHLKILCLILVTLGVLITAYQIFILKTPVSENETVTLWTVDARITFDAAGSAPAELRFFVPKEGNGYSIDSELFIANGYGQSIADDGSDRVVTWTARRVSGPQTLFYRVSFTKDMDDESLIPGETWRAPIAVEGPDEIAVGTLTEDIRQRSSNTRNFISTAISTVNDPGNNNVKLLLRGDTSAASRARVLELILSQAYIPIETAYMLNLSDGFQEPELWVRSYIEEPRHSSDDNSYFLSSDWYYFNIETAEAGMPQDRILWWTGHEDLIQAPGIDRARVHFNVNSNELSAIHLARLAHSGNIADFSFYSLPISTQIGFRIMLMIPIGVLVILLLRNVVGIMTLGTFTPVLIALAFRDTGLVFGLVFFSVIMLLGLSMRAYLEHLKLQMLPRLSLVLMFVILAIIASSMLFYRLGIERGLAATLFPMVILTMIIERLSITWEEKGGYSAFRTTLGTFFAAAVVYAVLSVSAFSYFVFTFPAVLLIVAAIMLAMGRYRGYRLTELFRFKAMIDKGC